MISSAMVESPTVQNAKKKIANERGCGGDSTENMERSLDWMKSSHISDWLSTASHVNRICWSILHPLDRALKGDKGYFGKEKGRIRKKDKKNTRKGKGKGTKRTREGKEKDQSWNRLRQEKKNKRNTQPSWST